VVHDDRSTTPGSPPAAEPSEPQAQRSEVGLATITLRQIRVSRADVQDKQDKLQDRSSSTDANPMNRLVPYLDLYARLSDDELARLAGVPSSVASNLRRQVVQVDRALARFTDLLPRLTDAELVRLTGATPKTIRFWRLCQPRFPMTGADAQGFSVAQAADTLGRVQSSAELPRRSPSSTSTGTYQAALGEDPPLDSGAPIGHGASERYAGRGPSDPPTGTFRMTTAERDAARASMLSEPPSGTLRMTNAERDAARALMNEPTTGTYRMTNAEREAYRPSTVEREGGSSAYRMPTAERDGSSAHRMPTAEREGGSSAYRMPTAERDAGRRAADGSLLGGNPATRTPSQPLAPVDLSRPRTGRTEEVPNAERTPAPATARPPAVVQKQQAVSQQMTFSGDPFPGYDAHGSGPEGGGEEDGIFIGLELPDPRTLAQPGRRE
jgi:hypothetical protein